MDPNPEALRTHVLRFLAQRPYHIMYICIYIYTFVSIYLSIATLFFIYIYIYVYIDGCWAGLSLRVRVR